MTIFMFVLYLVFMLSIGVYFYKQGKDDDTLSGYLLGGRELNPFVAAISAGASDMSGWLLMGLPGGAAYVSGYSAGWIGVGLALGTWLNWRLVAKRFRVYTEVAGDSITLSDYLKTDLGTIVEFLELYQQYLFYSFSLFTHLLDLWQGGQSYLIQFLAYPIYQLY